NSGTICSKSGNHLRTTFIRAHLELQLGEGNGTSSHFLHYYPTCLHRQVCGRKRVSGSFHFRGRTRFHPDVDRRCRIMYVPLETVYCAPFLNSPLSDADPSLTDARFPSMPPTNHPVPSSL